MELDGSLNIYISNYIQLQPKVCEVVVVPHLGAAITRLPSSNLYNRLLKIAKSGDEGLHCAASHRKKGMLDVCWNSAATLNLAMGFGEFDSNT